MKMLFSATAIALALSAGAALAADLPAIKAPPPPPPPPMWTGFYAGLNAGYSWGATNNVEVGTVNLFDTLGVNGPLPVDPSAGAAALAASGNAGSQRNGFIGGGQVGYNYQFGNSFLVGLEADIQGAGIRSENSFTGGSAWNAFTVTGPLGIVSASLDRSAAATTTVTARTDWLGTVRGRLGYLWGPSLLLYATGGLAYGGAKATTQQSLFLNNNLSVSVLGVQVLGLSAPFGSIGGFGRFDETRVGWTVGGGFEWLFAPNLSLKGEYLYYDLGTVRYQNGPLAAVGPQIAVLGFVTPPLVSINQGTTRVKFDGHIARVGINYHFISAPPVPVVARY